MTDLDLVKGCKKGRSKEQQELFYRYRNYAMGIGLRYAKKEDEARDIVQEAFIKIYKAIGQLKDANQLKSWIRKIVVNQCINFYHHELRFGHEEIADGLDIHDENYEDVLDHMSNNEILKLINALPDGYRLVFNMYVIEGYSHEEIASQLGISVVTSRTQLFKARKILKKRLTENCHEVKKLV